MLTRACRLKAIVNRNANSLSSFSSPVTEVRNNHFVDIDKLSAYLKTNGLHGFESGEVVVKQFAHGQSNPSFMLTTKSGKVYTVRKQPAGSLLAGAHAVDREYTVMTSLANTSVPVPKTRLYCSDPSILGSSFFVYGIDADDNKSIFFIFDYRLC